MNLAVVQQACSCWGSREERLLIASSSKSKEESEAVVTVGLAAVVWRQPERVTMAALANAAFAELLSRRDLKSFGGPEVGNGDMRKSSSKQLSYSGGTLVQGPPGAALRSRPCSAKPTPAAIASATKIQALWRDALQRRLRAQFLQKQATLRASREAAAAAKVAEAARKKQEQEEARQAREARARSAAEKVAADAAQRAAEAKARAAAEAEREAAARAVAQRESAERAAAEAAAAEAAAAAAALEAARRAAEVAREAALEATRRASERAAAEARLACAREARATALLRRRARDLLLHRRQRQRADAAGALLMRAWRHALVRRRAHRRLAARRKSLAGGQIRAALRRHALVRRSARDAAAAELAATRAAAATLIGAWERRRAGVQTWRAQRRAVRAIQMGMVWYALKKSSACAITRAVRAHAVGRRDRRAAVAIARAWRARRQRVLAQQQLRRAVQAARAICRGVRHLFARRRGAADLAERRRQRDVARAAWQRDNAAAHAIGGQWAAVLAKRRRQKQVRASVAIQSQIRGYLERERCPLLGGKQMFDFPRRIEELTLPFSASSVKLGAKAKADLAFVITTLKAQRSLKLRVCGCTLHTEARGLALERAKCVAAYLTTHGVLRQQLRAESRPPPFGEHGSPAACFVVVQNIFLPRRIAFDVGSGELPINAPPLLEKVARTLEAHAELDLVLEGHADAHEAASAELSNKRAGSVKRFLAANGIPASRLGVVAVGGACPVATNLTPQGRRHNRRVEMQIRTRG